MFQILNWFGNQQTQGLMGYLLVLVATSAAIALRFEIVTTTGAKTGFEIFTPVFLLLPLVTTRRFWTLSYALVLFYGWHWILPPDQSSFKKSIVCLSAFLDAILICEVVNMLRVSGRAANAARSRAEYLQNELTHRVQNILAIVLVLIHTTQRQKHKCPERALQLVNDRITGLSLANQALRTGPGISEFQLNEFLQCLLSPYLTRNEHNTNAVKVHGPAVTCPGIYLTPLGLAIHELATNAAKHGSLRDPNGTLEVSWSKIAASDTGATRVALNWTERRHTVNHPEPPKAAICGGFGFGLLMASAKQLDGTFTYDLTATGLQARLDFPLP